MIYILILFLVFWIWMGYELFRAPAEKDLF